MPRAARRAAPRRQRRRAAAAAAGLGLLLIALPGLLWARGGGEASGWAFAASTVSVPLWADFRTGRQPRTNRFVFTTNVVTNITEAIVGLEASMREKLAKHGVRSLPGPVVEAVLVDEDAGASALLEAKGRGLATYFARRKHDGVAMDDNAFFVYDAETQERIGGLDPAQARHTSMQRPLPLDVWQIVVDPKKVQEEEELMERYWAGVRGDGPYIQPPPKRARELFGRGEECVSVSRGRTLAKTIPLDPVLWAQALMMRNKAARRQAAELANSELRAAAAGGGDAPEKFSLP